MSVRIVTDSCSDLPPDTALACGITVVPLLVNAGGETYRDGVDISADRFYELLQSLPDLPTTSQPPPAEIAEIYDQLLEDGHDVVAIHVSSILSGTYNSASQAKEMSKDPTRITVVDSYLAGGALGLLALEAAVLAQQYDDHSEVAGQAEKRVERQTGYVMVDTLKYLAKGGRIGKAQAFMGGALQLKPILSVRDGAVHPEERPRTRKEGAGQAFQPCPQPGAGQPPSRKLHDRPRRRTLAARFAGRPGGTGEYRGIPIRSGPGDPPGARGNWGGVNAGLGGGETL